MRHIQVCVDINTSDHQKRLSAVCIRDSDGLVVVQNRMAVEFFWNIIALIHFGNQLFAEMAAEVNVWCRNCGDLREYVDTSGIVL